MRATIIYNSNSGGSGAISPDQIAEELARIGFNPIYHATSSEADLDAVLKRIHGLVVVSGGDGSVRAVATRLVGRRVPIAILPSGTANNIARSLGLNAPLSDLIAGLKDPLPCPFDIGLVRSPWGEDYFLEAMGFGLYADLLSAYQPDKGKSILRSITAAFETLPGYQTHPGKVLLDGRDISNDYLMVEALNTPAFGPRIKLAPQADPADGQLDLVCIRRDNQDSFLAYIRSLVAEDLQSLPSVEVLRGRKLEILMPETFTIHVDAELRPPPAVGKPIEEIPANGARPQSVETQNGRVVVRVLRRAVQFWLPRPVVEASPGGTAAPAEEAEAHGG